MRFATKISLITALLVASAGAALAEDTAAPRHVVPPSPSGDLVVALCDGETSVEVKGVKPGTALPRPVAQSVADQLMGDWKRKNPSVGATWDRENLLAQNGPGVVPPSKAPGPTPATTAMNVPTTPSPRLQDGHTYGAYTTRDEQVWRASTQAFVEQGSKLFHDAKAVGGTIAVSCDMCHPNAANTHPETYPKFQVQLGRVAMLRDMINWCIENPVRAKPLADDDPKMKALEAFIYAQRKGVPLEYGKH
jgi:cytochrome c553